MKKFTVLLAALVMAVQLYALDLGNNLSISGGVKTGFQIKNSDYAGKLEGVPHGGEEREYPLTLFFASRENDAYNGEGWLELGYSAGTWGLKLGAWSHGGLKESDDVLHLGDHYFWANFFGNRLKLIGGQGGGTPISSGGWINADWLGYTGLRLFWIDPSGLSAGINFTAPEAEGIKPGDYFSTIMLGVKYDPGLFWLSFMVANTPIYDDSEANYDGGLHDRKEKIAQSGNIAFGAGMPFLGGRLNLAFDGMVTNLGEEDVATEHGGNYKISPIETTLALKGGFSFTEKIYAELKTKYIINSGDNADNTGAATWGRFAVEPYGSYQMFDFVKLQLSFNLTWYINSYYLAVDANPVAIGSLKAGQVPPYPSAFDYYSQYQLTIEPSMVFSVLEGASIVTGYKGDFSRDHVENSLYVDFRWSF
jgi:hypothetical protein